MTVTVNGKSSSVDIGDANYAPVSTELKFSSNTVEGSCSASSSLTGYSSLQGYTAFSADYATKMLSAKVHGVGVTYPEYASTQTYTMSATNIYAVTLSNFPGWNITYTGDTPLVTNLPDLMVTLYVEAWRESGSNTSSRTISTEHPIMILSPSVVNSSSNTVTYKVSKILNCKIYRTGSAASSSGTLRFRWLKVEAA